MPIEMGCNGSLTFGDQEPYGERGKIGSRESMGQRCRQTEGVIQVLTNFCRNSHLKALVEATIGGGFGVFAEQ